MPPKEKADKHAASLRPPTSGSDAATSAPPSPRPPAIPPHSFQLTVAISEGRNLFSVDDRDDPDAAKKKKTAGKAAPSASASAASEPPRSAKGGSSSSSQKKKKGGKAEEEEVHYPFHCFLTYAPFEPILVEQPTVAVVAPTKEKKGSSKHAAGDDAEHSPPPPVYSHSVQTPLSADSLNPTLDFQHTQFVLSKEHFLDAINQAPLKLNVWQYFPAPSDGKKRKPSGASSATGGKDVPPSPRSTATGSSKKKKKGKGEEEEAPPPFGDLDPDSVVRIGEIDIDLTSVLHGLDKIEGWFPVQVSDETINNARGIATSRGKTVPSLEQGSQVRPEFHVKIAFDRMLVDAAEEARSNYFEINIERVERLPNWILDCAQMEAIENIKKQQALAAEAAAQQGEGNAKDGKGDASGRYALSLSGVQSPSGANQASSARAKKGKGEPNPLDEFPEKDYTDSFSMTYNLPISSKAEQQKTIHPSQLTPVVGWNENERAQVKVGTGHEWVAPLREIVVEEIPVSGKKSDKKKSDTGSGGKTSGRSTPHAHGGSAGDASSAEEKPVQYQPPLEWNPSTPRASLLLNHARHTFLTSGATQALKDSIAAGKPFLVALEHVRLPNDEKLQEAGRITQHALVLADLRPLLKPGCTTLEGYFAVRQTSAPLPPKLPDEGKKKKGGSSSSGSAAAAGASPTLNKRASLLSPVNAEEPAPILPPETFDEARTFVKMSIRLEKPLVARKAHLNVADVLPGGQKKLEQPSLMDSFLSTGAGASVALPHALLSEPRQITYAPKRPATVAAGSAQKVDDLNLKKQLDEMRKEVRALVRRMVEEYEASKAPVAATASPLTFPVSSPRGQHALPQPAAATVSTNQAAAGSKTVSLQQLLNSSSLGLHFLQSLKPKLSALIEARFHLPPSTSGLSAPTREHRLNELFAELSQEAAVALREIVSVRTAQGAQQEHETQLAKDAAQYLAKRAAFDKAGKLASYAERHNDLLVSSLYHQNRIATLLELYNDNHHSFPDSSAFDTKDLVAAWYEYGCFLLRRQNGAEAFDPELVKANNGFVPKTGSIDGGANAAIDLAEECLKQCLRYNPHFIPALVNLCLLNLEQNEVEHALEYVHRAINSMQSVSSHQHVLLLAVQGLYHQLAEEDELRAGAFHRASEVLHEFLNNRYSVDHSANHQNGTDVLLQAMLGEHGRGCYSLPLFHSQSIHLILSRYLSSMGFRCLEYVVLTQQVSEMDLRLTNEQSELAQKLQEQDEEELNENDETNFHIGRYDYYQFGPYLEMANWLSMNNSKAAWATTEQYLRRSTDIIERKSLDHHHSHSLLYAFATQGEIYYRNNRFDEASQSFFMYLSMLEEKNMNYFLDPIIFTQAATLYLKKHVLSESLNLSTLLVTHPLHTHDPFVWVLLGQVLTSLGEFAKAEETLSEAISKMEWCGRAHAVYTICQLRRVQSELHQRNKFTHGHSSLTAVDFVEAFHTFEHVIYSPAPCSDVGLLVELGRLWFKHSFIPQTEACYTRALLIDSSDDSIRQKLNWLLQAKEGVKPEREEKAAIAIQSVLKGAIARKQVKKKKMMQQIEANKQRSEEEKEVEEF